MIDVAEDIRMRYRFIDLRRPEMQKTLAMRHKAALAARNYMNEHGFLEIETPYLDEQYTRRRTRCPCSQPALPG